MYIWGALKNSFSPPEVNIQSFICQTPGSQHIHQYPEVKIRADFQLLPILIDTAPGTCLLSLEKLKPPPETGQE